MKIRTTEPSSTNKYYLKAGKGGYNRAMEIDSNTHSTLPNCVAMAHGRWMEAIEETDYNKFDKLATGNAENYYGKTSDGYERGQIPKQGAIICWRKGKAGDSSDGAGHVEFVEKVYSDTKILTSASAYKGFRYRSYTRNKGSNGNWGMSSPYVFQGFIYNPYIKEEPAPTPSGEWPKYHTIKSGDTLSGIAEKYYGNGSATYYNYIAQANGISNPNIIRAGKTLTIPEFKGTTPTPQPTPAPTPTPSTGLKVGDTVKIIGTGKASSYGSGATAGGIGWTRKILRIYEGRACPYQVGNNSGTTGFYPESSLQKL